MIKKGRLKENASVLELIIKLADMLIVFLCSWLSYSLYANIDRPFSDYVVASLIASLIASIIFQEYGFYTSKRGKFFLDEIKLVTSACISLFLILALIAVITKTSEDYSRVWFVLWWLLTITGLISFRGFIRYSLKKIRKYGFNQRQVVLAGNTGFVLDVYDILNNDQWSGFDVQGFFSEALKNTEKGFIGTYDQLESYVLNNNIDQVMIAAPLRDEAMIKKILAELKHSSVDIRFIPDISGFNPLNHSVSEISGLASIELSASPLHGIASLFKRLIDVMLSVLILLVSIPLMIVIAARIKMTSEGTVLYKQKRVGWNNKEFTMYKFRTMYTENNDSEAPVWNRECVTTFGQWLRQTNLDELPQFFNVLKGDMSIVGPRPERPYFIKKFRDEIPYYMKKHMVRAGITGWAQVNGWRGDTDISKRIEYDLFYIENWSIWFDIKIMLLTLINSIKIRHNTADRK
jgi:putative colanic acid biosynthesis UDP-glucose lipid carrier transferase